MRNKKVKVNLYGGGPSNLMLALSLCQYNLFDISIFDQNKRFGSKFLVAGKGGFNLSHWEEIEPFKKRYYPSNFLSKSIHEFTPTDLRELLKNIGIETYVGTSNRIFPNNGIKPIEVLNKILNKLEKEDVRFIYSQKFVGFSPDGVNLESKDEIYESKADYHVFAFGGKSWSKTGSDGAWTEHFKKEKIKILPFLASNCGIELNLQKTFLEKYEGVPIKNIAIEYRDFKVKGEFVISNYGIEGNAIYPISGLISRDESRGLIKKLDIDFKPIWTKAKLEEKLNGFNGNMGERLKRAGIKKVVIDWIKEGLSREEWGKIGTVSQCLKEFPVDVVRTRPIEESISTQGGIDTNELTENFELLKRSSNFCIGEMIDWDASTGGYLLHGCFAMGIKVAREIKLRTKEIK